jgi:hypothetical protein
LDYLIHANFIISDTTHEILTIAFSQSKAQASVHDKFPKKKAKNSKLLMESATAAKPASAKSETKEEADKHPT